MNTERDGRAVSLSALADRPVMAAPRAYREGCKGRIARAGWYGRGVAWQSDRAACSVDDAERDNQCHCSKDNRP
jgi:hypothetical protein